jgi:hypothetical protein
MFAHAEKHSGKKISLKDAIMTESGKKFVAGLGMKKDELAKVKLPMPNANAHHDVVLPAGSQVDDKLKVTHQDGHTSWKQMAAGQIRSMDPAGHPTSSRSPNSK